MDYNYGECQLQTRRPDHADHTAHADQTTVQTPRHADQSCITHEQTVVICHYQRSFTQLLVLALSLPTYRTKSACLTSLIFTTDINYRPIRRRQILPYFCFITNDIIVILIDRVDLIVLIKWQQFWRFKAFNFAFCLRKIATFLIRICVFATV